MGLELKKRTGLNRPLTHVEMDGNWSGIEQAFEGIISTDPDLGGVNPSNTQVPSQRAVKTYVDKSLGGGGAQPHASAAVVRRFEPLSAGNSLIVTQQNHGLSVPDGIIVQVYNNANAQQIVIDSDATYEINEKNGGISVTASVSAKWFVVVVGVPTA